jgi:hypothetical protein
MSFNALVRYDDGGKAVYGDLLQITPEGYKVAKFNGNIAEGFTSAEMIA